MKKILCVTGLTAMLVLGLSLNLKAENVQLENIVITASRTEENSEEIARNIDVITSEDIEISAAKDTAEILEKVTSMDISNYGGLGATKTLRMRGSNAAQVLVLVDGRPINNPRDGEVELSALPIENIERIEVMHGPASSIYGAGAMGGTVHIITKKPPKERQETELTSSIGTYRTFIERFSHGGRIEKLGYLFSGSYVDSEGFRDNSEFDAKDLTATFEYDLNNDHKLTLYSSAYKTKTGTPGAISSPDIDDEQRILKKTLDLTWDYKPEENSAELSAKIYQSSDRLEFSENSAGSIFDTAFKKDIHTTQTQGANIQYNNQFNKTYRLVCGLNYTDNENNSTTSAKHGYNVRALYAQNHIVLLDEKLNLNLGARIDDYSNFGTEVNPSLSMVYKLTPYVKTRALISRSFRAPTFNDLYWPDEGWAKGNPDVKPEKGITGEAGIDIKPNSWLVSGLTFYRNDYSNLINWAEASGVWSPQNVGSAIIDGIEFTNSVSLSQSFTAQFDYTFLKAKDDKNNTYLIYQPKHKIDGALKYTGIKGWIFQLTGQHIGKRFHDASNTIKIKKFYVIGLDITWKKENASYFLSIDNLLNKRYESIRDYPAPGFSVTAGMKLKF